MKPTKKQWKEVLVWCGFTPRKVRVTDFNDAGEMIKKWQTHWSSPDDDKVWYAGIPDIDLNNLFKYAVPKLREILKDDSKLMQLLKDWVVDFILDDLDPALALFWAIWEMIHET